mmetsp:Transcript_19975/g.41573  ORF Transcript_19975/g.41573 Transcript_19975/m.41573 type:complete len:333 (-) Transcript_19975:104-1102(-)
MMGNTNRQVKMCLLSVLIILASPVFHFQPCNDTFIAAFSTSTTTTTARTPSSTSKSSDGFHRSRNNTKAAVIFLHGLGDTPDGWSKLTEVLPSIRPNLANIDITYVFPPAPYIGVSVNGGEKMPGWFDVFDWPIGLDAKDDPKGLAQSVRSVEKIVKQLEEEEGIHPSRVVIGGFSQGGAVALMAAYNRRKKDAIPFAGCICLSGWLPMKQYLDIDEGAAESTPLLWAHGQHDKKIVFEQQTYGVNKLENAGVDVTACTYPVGHETADFEEIADMADFLESVLAMKAAKPKKPRSADPDFHGEEEAENEDETNALLYYLCAIGIEESLKAAY